MDQFFITGTSQGLGKALVEEALKRGAYVHGVSRSKPFEKEGYKHYSYDLSDTQGLEALAKSLFQIDESAERLILINNAGTLGDVAYAGEWQADTLARTYAINLTAPVILMNSFLEKFNSSSKEKLIINISSGAAKNPYDGWSAYCSGKAGLEMYTRVLSLEAEKKGGSNVKAWSVAPGVVDTGMQDQLRRSDKENFSNLDRFLQLKEEGKLTPPSVAAGKIFSILDTPENFPDPVQDIRNF